MVVDLFDRLADVEENISRVWLSAEIFDEIDSSSDTIVRVFNRWANGEVNIFGIWVISLMVYCIENIDKISTSSV